MDWFADEEKRKKCGSIVDIVERPPRLRDSAARSRYTVKCSSAAY